ncbi:MAG: FecR domain-containing protein [Pseudomonadota bacterium]
MDTPPNDQPSSESRQLLVDQALKLLIATRDYPAERRRHDLAEWRALSQDHAAAMDKAMSTWGVLSQVSDRPISLTEKMRLNAETALAGARDFPGRTGVLACLLLCCVLVPFGLQTVTNQFDRQTVYDRYALENEPKLDRITTQRGEQRKVEFVDGIEVWLNWNTDILIADRKDGLHVDLRLGDVLFLIPKRIKKRIIIHAGDAIVRPKGSEFAVHAHSPQDGFFQVRRGSIIITSTTTDDQQSIGAAQQAFFLEGKAHDIEAVDVASIATWKDGKLVFDQWPLKSVLHALSHYTEQKLTVGDITDKPQTVTATYPIDDADSALVQLAAAYDLEVLSPSDSEIIIQSTD